MHGLGFEGVVRVVTIKGTRVPAWRSFAQPKAIDDGLVPQLVSLAGRGRRGLVVNDELETRKATYKVMGMDFKRPSTAG